MMMMIEFGQGTEMVTRAAQELSMKKDEGVHGVNAPLGNSPFPIASLPLCSARLHSLDLFLHFMQFIVAQFTLDTVVGGAEWSWITETCLEGRQFPLEICI